MPSSACLARRLARSTRSSESRTTTASRLSSTRARARRLGVHASVLTERLRTAALPGRTDPELWLAGVARAARCAAGPPRPFTTWLPPGYRFAPARGCRTARIRSSDGEGPDHRGRRRHRPRHGPSPGDGGLRHGRRGERRDRPRAPQVRAPGRLRARPHASRSRRLARDRAGARRGDRHADRRRVGARHRARPRARARDRGGRLPREAVLDEGARRASARPPAAG